MNAVSEITRRSIFDALRIGMVAWEGRLGESAFLSRIFDLTKLSSCDYRAGDMLGDVILHREHFRDWDDHWPYDDGRLNLLRGPDDEFLRFLTEMIHPVVRSDDEEVERLLSLFNRHLGVDGFQLTVMDRISGKRIFTATRSLNLAPLDARAHELADELSSDHVSAQITRMQTSLGSDPALAIGSAKEFVESICKGILSVRRIAFSGKEDLPKLVHQVREALDLGMDKRAEVAIRSTLGALATLTQGIAELRGQLGTGHGARPDVQRPSMAVARLAVGAATSLGIFLWDLHREILNPAPVAEPEEEEEDDIPF